MIDIEIGGVQAQRDAVRALTIGSNRRIGLEADNVTWGASRRWTELLAADGAAEVVPTTGLVEALREVKDAGEVARMQQAAAIADRALAEVLPLLVRGGRRPGHRGRVRSGPRHGDAPGWGESTAFDTIVAAGSNSAKPHHRPSERPIRPGDPVVVDFGATFEGYRSDMTRTFCIGGEPQGELARIFEVVRRSQAEGVAAVGPGVGAKDVDEVCRQVIAEAGWAERFEHGTGHGVGLDIHEAPTVSPLGTAILAPGVIVTVEPGCTCRASAGSASRTRWS